MAVKLEPVTHGDVLRVVDASGFRLTETRHSARLHLASHAHRHPSLTCVLRGSFEEIFRSGAFECRAHTVLFKPGGEPHADRYGPEGAHCLLIEIPEHRARLAAPQGGVLRATHSQASALVSLLVHELRADDALATVAIEGLALELLAMVGRAILPESPARRPRRPRWLDAALEELRGRFREPVTMRDLANAVAVHPTHLARVFRRHEGTTPSEYVRRLRVEWAKTQLVRTDLPLALIAQDAGFADQSHFTRVFTRVVGRSPARFRARCGRESEPPFAL